MLLQAYLVLIESLLSGLFTQFAILFMKDEVKDCLHGVFLKVVEKIDHVHGAKTRFPIWLNVLSIVTANMIMSLIN